MNTDKKLQDIRKDIGADKATISKTISEARRNELNELNKNNRRLELGLSRKDYKRLKKFQEITHKVLSNKVIYFFEELAVNGLSFDDEKALIFFEAQDLTWRNYIRPLINKLNIFNRQGIVDNLEMYTKQVKKFLDSGIGKDVKDNTTKAMEQQKLEGIMESPIAKKIIKVFLTYNPEQEIVEHGLFKDYRQLIKYLKSMSKAGTKMKFANDAKSILNIHEKELRELLEDKFGKKQS